MDKYIQDIEIVQKSQKPIVDAIQELELAKQAFIRSSRIESRISEQDELIAEIKTKMEMFSTFSYVNAKNNEFYSFVEEIVKNKLEEFTFQLMFEMSKKANDSECKKLFDGKVSWNEFLNLKATISGMRLKLDTFLEVEYPAHKNKLNAKLKEKNLDKPEGFLEKLESIAGRFSEIEQKILEIQRGTKKKPKVMNEKEAVIQRIKTFNQTVESSSNLLFEKLEDIEKELSNIFSENNSSKMKFSYLEEVIKSILNEFQTVNFRCSSLEKMQKDQEERFITILRNKDLQINMKKDNILTEKLSSEDVEKMRKEIAEKNKRVVIIENSFSYMKTELDYIKKQLKEVREKSENFKSELSSKIEPSTITITNDSLIKSGELKKSFKILELEDLRMKRSYEAKPGIFEDFSKTVAKGLGKRSASKMSERIINISPRISGRFKY